MADNAQQFRARLKATGLTDSAINAAWPEWWSDAADASASAQAELRFSLARKLGLDPRSLFDDDAPKFFWDDSAKYKNFKGDPERDRPAITAFGNSISRMLIKGAPFYKPLIGLDAKVLRDSILANQPFVRLVDLLATLWAMGVPTAHLRVYPLAAKRMCAMASRSGERFAILLAKDSNFPASVAFHVAHEIGHIALGHIGDGSALIDMEDTDEHVDESDAEEKAADRYALELLTGDPDFTVAKEGRGRNPQQLASEALTVGPANRIEPGTLALCYAHVTDEWATLQAAMPYIYTQSIPAWSVTNKIASSQLDWDAITDENASFLRAVMGAV